jgi:exopolyphosphatase/guanosine-5'-triphosphate,3'-diphosphate pyrophosphatase
MIHRSAIIDLGTNTFHLLIADPDPLNGFREVHRVQSYTKLGFGGINYIEPAYFNRGISVLKDFRKKIDQFGVREVRAIGTAALRTASNGHDFVANAYKEAGIAVNVIDGAEEARLIYRGVSMACPVTDHSHTLIMDIGGGSVEFILTDSTGMLWAQSFPVGVAVLYRHFHHHEPMLKEEKDALNDFLEDKLQPLLEVLHKQPASYLVGAAGAFDVVEGMILGRLTNTPFVEVPLIHFPEVFQRVTEATLEGRLQLKNLPPQRADLIVVGFLLIDFILRKAKISKIGVSHYALKEGILRELWGL